MRPKPKPNKQAGAVAKGKDPKPAHQDKPAELQEAAADI